MSGYARNGWFLMVTAVLHTILGVFVFWKPLYAIITAGMVNSITPYYDRGMVFWFLLFGGLLWLLGQTIAWMETHGGHIPESVGWGLFGLALLGAIMMPVSGFWLVLPQAYLLIRSARRPTNQTKQVA